MSCPSWHDAILERVAGDLSGPPAEAVDRHLASCSTCRRVAESWQRLAEEAGSVAIQPAPAASVALAKVRALTAAERPRQKQRWLGRLLATWPWALPTQRPQRLAWSFAGLAAVSLGIWLLGRQAAGLDLMPSGEQRQRQSDAGSASRDAAGEGARPGSSAGASDGLAETGRSAGLPTEAVGAGPMARATASPSHAADGRAAGPRPPASIAQAAPPLAETDGGPAGADLSAPSERAPESFGDPAPQAGDEGGKGGGGRGPQRERTATTEPRPAPDLPRPTAMPPLPSATPLPSSPDQPRRAGLARVAGWVVDPAGRPVPLALVYLRPVDGDAAWGLALSDTDANGSFSIDLPPGRWALWAEAEGRPPAPYVDEPVLELSSDSRREGLVLRLPVIRWSPTAPAPPSPTVPWTATNAPSTPTAAASAQPTALPPSPSPTAPLDAPPPSATAVSQPNAVASRPATSDAAPKELAP